MILIFVLAAAAFPLAAQTGPAYRFVKEVDSSGRASLVGLGTDAAGYVYVVANTRSSASAPFHVTLTRLDPDGNTVNSVTLGGSGDDQASGVAVDAVGNTYIAGVTRSADFPVTKGAWLTTPPSAQGSTFLMKVNTDGTPGYSTFFSTNATPPTGVAVDSAGSVYLSGLAMFPASLPVTPGAYQATCKCGFYPTLFISIPYNDGFLARFDATGSKLLFATYLGVLSGAIGGSPTRPVAIAADGSAYVIAGAGVFRLDGSGSSLLSSMYPATVNPQAMAMGRDGSIYLAGAPVNTLFQTTAGVFQDHALATFSLPSQVSTQPVGLVRIDSGLTKVIAATYFGGAYGASIWSMTTDAVGNLYLGGWSSPRGLPTVTPLAQGFGSPSTGFVAKASGDLSSLQFSGYFGDAENFGITSVAIGQSGNVILGGVTGNTGTFPTQQGNVWINGLTLAGPPTVRVDSVQNAASLLGDPISVGETVVVNGTGFTSGAQVVMNGVAAKVLSTQDSRVTAVVPAGVSGTYATVQVQSGGAGSNSVLVPVGAASPGIFSQDGSGFGQGYIFNQDGTLNSPSHAAGLGERITLYATGIGPFDLIDGYAQTTTPVTVLIDGFYCNGVAAFVGPVSGLPGDVYRLTVYVPTMAQVVAVNPDLASFKFPPQVGITLRVAGGVSQNGLAISIAQ
jgi:uncharacterized protein (TIGR03437 family)